MQENRATTETGGEAVATVHLLADAAEGLFWIRIETEVICVEAEQNGPGAVLRSLGREWRVFPSREAAGLHAREAIKEMAESDPMAFTDLVGGFETIYAWSFGDPAGPGTAQVTSAAEYLDTFLDDCAGYYASHEEEIAECSAGLVDAIGFFPRLAYLADEEMCAESRFHLAFHASWLNLDSPERAAVLLVPDDLSPFVGAMSFQMLDASGAPAGWVTAHMSDLASFREPDDTAGFPAPREKEILIALSARAFLARLSLSSIHATTRYPQWAKRILTSEQLDLIVQRIINSG